MTGPSRKSAIATEEKRAADPSIEAARSAASSDDGEDCDPGDACDVRLAAVARAEYGARRRRDRLFDEQIFAEPAWDMLLDLFVQRHQGRSVSVHSLCIAATVPQTTALRWIAKLTGNGLINRRPCPRDNRVIHIELSERGLAIMTRYLQGRLAASDVDATPPLSFN